MTEKKDENLELLLRQFVDDAQARQMSEDIGYAERLFERFPAPSARPEMLTAVNRKVQAELEHHKRFQVKIRWCCDIAIAALVLLGLFILYSNAPDNSPPPPPVQVAVGGEELNTDFSFSVDTSVVEIEQEITRLSEAINAADADTGELVGPPFSTDNSPGTFITVSTEFWKG